MRWHAYVVPALLQRVGRQKTSQKLSLKYAAWEKEDECCYDLRGLGSDLTGTTRDETTYTEREKLGSMWTLMETTN